MAERESLPVQAIKLAQNVATGRHFLSRLVPPALLVLDAALCLVIIKKVPCELSDLPTSKLRAPNADVKSRH